MAGAEVHLGFTIGPSAPIMASERRSHGAMATGVNDYHLLPIFLISLIVLLSATEFGGLARAPPMKEPTRY